MSQGAGAPFHGDATKANAKAGRRLSVNHIVDFEEAAA
jgi:hypothetical protein